MKVTSPPIRSHFGPAAPLVGLLVCAALASAQVDVPEVYVDPGPGILECRPRWVLLSPARHVPSRRRP